jgi:hypothetical protein
VTPLFSLAPWENLGPFGNFSMFLHVRFGPFVRIPRTFTKTWGGNISLATCGLSIRAHLEKHRAKLDKLIKLEVLDALI